MKKKQSILLIAFKFPPYAGVGSFRWSKISKYLSKKGYKIHVITVNWNRIGPDSLSSDVNQPNILIHRTPSFYPHNLKYKRFNHNSMGKAFHITRHGLLKVFDILGYEDEAYLWGKNIIPLCEKIIKREKIKNVISTGAPFMANYWSSKLKIRNPNINLILDFRDPWTKDVHNVSNIKLLKKRSLEFEEIKKLKFFRKRALEFEKNSVNNCDVVVSVTQGVLDGFMERVESERVKGVVIRNGHDIEISKMKPITSRDFTFIYAGSLYGREKPFESFLKAICDIVDEIPEIKIDIYGGIPDSVKSNYSDLIKKNILRQYDRVSPNEINQKIYESFVCLQVNSEYFPEAATTKVYEYAALKRPTLSVNYGGEVDRIMNEFNFGVSVDGNNVKQIMKEIMNFYSIWKKNQNYEIFPKKINELHYKNIASKFEKYLIE